MIDETKIGKGGILSKPDKRDIKWRKIGAASIPFDWDKGFDIEKELAITLPVKDQNGSFSCGGQAVATYGAVLNTVYDKKHEERSAKFIYAPIHYPAGGTVGRDLMDSAVKTGFGLETLTPSYEFGMPPSEEFMVRVQDITDEAKSSAKKERAFSYASVSTLDINSIAQAIRDNKGMLMGINGENNGTWTSAFPKPPVAFTWRHWVYAGKAKLINGKKYIGFLNSWGKGVGESGWQWIGEDYLNSGNCFENWTLVYNTKPDPSFKHAFNTDIEFGSKGDEVVALQKALRLEGLFNYPTDTGSYGIFTQKAVYDFQIKYNLAPFSRWIYRGKYCHGITRAKLNSLYNT